MTPTRDHKSIRSWADRHGAAPAEVMVHVFDSEPTMLYFLFGDARAGTPELRPISWEDFFARFDLLGLALAYDEETQRFDLVRLDKSHPGIVH